MNKKILFFTIFVILIGGFVFGYLFFKNKNSTSNLSNNNINSARLSAEANITPQANNIIANAEANKSPTETELSSYSTQLKAKASGRLNNIRITCTALNGHVVSPNETFSFCNTLGPSTAEKGYQKADVIVDKKTVQALGGGNCQVSSTLYNAVLAVPELTVVERHEHGKRVTYVPKDRDAAVSYGSLDFKFKNTLSNDIKLYFSTDDSTVIVRICKITY